MITFTIKQLGVKKPILESQGIVLDASSHCLLIKDLIAKLVTDQVEKFNKQQSDNVLQHLTAKQIEHSLETGKVSFGKTIDAKIQKKPKIQNYDAALLNALTAFKDGIYCVFIDGKQYERLDQKVELMDNTEVSFVRLTLLTGQRF